MDNQKAYDSSNSGRMIRKQTLREKLEYEITNSERTIAYETERIKEAELLLKNLNKNKELESMVNFLTASSMR